MARPTATSNRANAREIAAINACSRQRAVQPVGSTELAEVKAPKAPLAREHLGTRPAVDC
jgi:hypothetical protein